jgi:hypothetical protein
MRGRPRKPVADLALEGRFRADRHGEPATIWQPAGAPTPPDWLSDDARQLWHLADSATGGHATVKPAAPSMSSLTSNPPNTTACKS